MTVNDKIVLGYVRENVNEWIPYVILQIIKVFLDYKVSCKLFVSFQRSNKEHIIHVKPNCRAYLAITNHNRLIIPHDYAFKDIKKNEANIAESLEIIGVSGGVNHKHFYVYTSDNELYGISLDDYDNLGLGSEYLSKARKFIRFDIDIMKSNIIQIECGYWHTLFLTKLGNVYD